VERGGGHSLTEGFEALHGGRWADAVGLLERALDDVAEDPSKRADLLDALADARWWLGEPEAATADREQVYRARREAGDQPGAVRAAAWLAREYAAGLGNLPAARGWLARAETLARDETDPGIVGWVALAQALLATGAVEQAAQASRALECARSVGDGDLEVLSLARWGLALVISGHVDAGLSRLDEAMASASAGDAVGVTTAAQLCCDFVLASELSGDPERFSHWAHVVERIAKSRGGPSPVSFCTTCCAEQSVGHGDFAGAERQLHVAVVELQQSGRRSRCIPPAAKLAELYLLQGRVEEAERAIEQADDDTSLILRARIALAHQEAGLATTLAERAIRRLGAQGAAAVPALAVLVEAQLLAGDDLAAEQTLARLEEVARTSADRRSLGVAALTRGRVALAWGAAEEAATAFESVLDISRGHGSLEGACAHLELARLRSVDRPQVALVDAKAALRGFEELGATQHADAAAALLRTLGDRSRVGPKDVGLLSKRELEVLRLVAQGLTNAEIAARLFISTKTAGNHVSAILMKLGLRSRTEVAAHAAQLSQPI